MLRSEVKMKAYIFLIIILLIFPFTRISATQLNGRVVVINNDGNNYKILLQINTDSQAQKMGGATFVLDYDTTSLSFPDNPEIGNDYNFRNFSLGYYDTAKVTKIKNGRIWLNIDLSSDGHGTDVQEGPDQWSDLVELNFGSSHNIQNNVVSWNPGNRFWQVYAEDNTSSWDNGSFDLVTYAAESDSHNDISYNLNQNYPNPFNPTTTIVYSVPQRSIISLVVYNAIGQQVSVLANEEKEVGTYRINFDATGLPSGIYFYRLSAGNFVTTKKMVLLK